MRRIGGFAICTIVALAMLWSAAAQADVRLPHIFGGHMVLQRDRAIPVWGWANAGEKIEVKLADRPAVSTTAAADGTWRVTLPAMPAGGPYSLSAKGDKTTVVCEDVLIGEVWLCSGQSNMEMIVGSSMNFEQEKAAANYPSIRHIKVSNTFADYPRDDFNAAWQVCEPNTVGGFTAAGYFMARELNKELKVPVGLINASWGGTLIEPWTPPIGFDSVPALDSFSKRIADRDPKNAAHKQILGDYVTGLEGWIAKAKTSLASETPVDPAPGYPDALKPFVDQQQPTALYNSMIHPLIPFAIRGAIWYQGESNHWDRGMYTEKKKALVNGWRKLWNEGDFPFYYVQIAPYSYGNEDPNVLPSFWEAQTACLAIPNTGQVVINDIAMLDNIHPVNKQEVGRRLALLALNKDYGKKDVVCSGPTFKSLATEGNKLRVRFDNIGSGLASRDGKPLTWFEIIGPDTDFVKADAVIDGDSVLLSSPDVKAPAAMRFAWSKNAEPNFMNKEGLPATAFRAGEVPKVDYLALKVPEAKDYKLIYALDLNKLGANITYDVNNPDKFAGAFDRIAYFLELKKDGEQLKYVYVSMDAFTNDLTKIGLPTVASKATFQTNVANMNVISNMQGIATGTGIAGGNIEFWPNNYGQANSAKVPGASDGSYDFGDQMTDPVDGYGCMQVHNHDAKQTIFAINHWVAGGSADIGIGNSPDKNPDWTFTGNAGSYMIKQLRVLVHPKG